MGFQGCSRVVSTRVPWLRARNRWSGKIRVPVTDPLLYEKLMQTVFLLHQILI